MLFRSAHLAYGLSSMAFTLFNKKSFLRPFNMKTASAFTIAASLNKITIAHCIAYEAT